MTGVGFALIDEYDYTVYQPITAKDLRGEAGRLRFHYPETPAERMPPDCKLGSTAQEPSSGGR